MDWMGRTDKNLVYERPENNESERDTSMRTSVAREHIAIFDFLYIKQSDTQTDLVDHFVGVLFVQLVFDHHS